MVLGLMAFEVVVEREFLAVVELSFHWLGMVLGMEFVAVVQLSFNWLGTKAQRMGRVWQ